MLVLDHTGKWGADEKKKYAMNEAEEKSKKQHTSFSSWSSSAAFNIITMNIKPSRKKKKTLLVSRQINTDIRTCGGPAGGWKGWDCFFFFYFTFNRE